MSRGRTRVTEDSEQVDPNESADDGSQQSLGSAGKRKRMRTGRPTKDRSQIVRATYESTEELEWMLNQLAQHLGVKKYDLVFRLLEQGCNLYGISEYLRVAFAHIKGESTKVA